MGIVVRASEVGACVFGIWIHFPARHFFLSVSFLFPFLVCFAVSPFQIKLTTVVIAAIIRHPSLFCLSSPQFRFSLLSSLVSFPSLFNSFSLGWLYASSCNGRCLQSGAMRSASFLLLVRLIIRSYGIKSFPRLRLYCAHPLCSVASLCFRPWPCLERSLLFSR